jgi:hypothetical protein
MEAALGADLPNCSWPHCESNAETKPVIQRAPTSQKFLNAHLHIDRGIDGAQCRIRTGNWRVDQHQRSIAGEVYQRCLMGAYA